MIIIIDLTKKKPVETMDLTVEEEVIDLTESESEEEAHLEWWEKSTDIDWPWLLHTPFTVKQMTDVDYLQDLLRNYMPCGQPKTWDSLRYVDYMADCIRNRLCEINTKSSQTDDVGEKHDRCCLDIDEIDVTLHKNGKQRNVNTGMFLLE